MTKLKIKLDFVGRYFLSSSYLILNTMQLPPRLSHRGLPFLIISQTIAQAYY